MISHTSPSPSGKPVKSLLQRTDVLYIYQSHFVKQHVVQSYRASKANDSLDNISLDLYTKFKGMCRMLQL